MKYKDGLYSEYINSFEKKYIEKVDIVLANSEELQDKLKRKYKNLQTVEVIYKSPPHKKSQLAKPRTLRTDLNLKESDKKIILYLGQVQEKRGIEKVLSSLNYLENVHFAVITKSGGSFLDSLKLQAKEMGINKQFHVLSYVPSKDIMDYISDANVGLIPYEKYNHSEVTLPNKLFNYVFADLPIISNNLSAVSRFLKINNAGISVSFADPKKLAVEIKNYLNRAGNKSTSLCRNKKIIETYSWEVQSCQLLSIYLLVRGYENFTIPNGITPIVTPESKLRILQGITGAAGQPHILSQALNNLPGIFSNSMQVTLSKFGYPADIFFLVKKTDFSTMAQALKIIIKPFDVFHLHTRGFLYDRLETTFPTGSDLLLLKAAGKKVIIHFRGSEARLQSEFEKNNPFNYIHDDIERTIEKFPEHAKRKYISLATDICDAIFVNDPEIQSYVPGSHIIERAIDLTLWNNVGVEETNEPLIVHAPSRRGVKGTEYVIKAVESLKKKGFKFKFQLVESMPHAEARAVYERADIIVDQLRIGWYGVLAVEAMALGKPVVAYIREDLEYTLGSKPPVINANPYTIELALKDLITDYNYRKEMSMRARSYCEKVHDSNVVAKKLEKIYKKIQASPKDLNVNSILDHLVNQHNEFNNKYIASLAREKKYKNSINKLNSKLSNSHQGVYEKSFNKTIKWVAKVESDQKNYAQQYSKLLKSLQNEKIKFKIPKKRSSNFRQKLHFVRSQYSTHNFFSASKYFIIRFISFNRKK
ncbi:glycosyltransferase [Hellea sp.]|nr:glycosyltransferase [Hellea sp.]